CEQSPATACAGRRSERGTSERRRKRKPSQEAGSPERSEGSQMQRAPEESRSEGVVGRLLDPLPGRLRTLLVYAIAFLIFAAAGYVLVRVLATVAPLARA